MADDTYATIGLEGPAATSGIPNAADPSIVEDSTQPITPYFLTDGATSVVSNTVTGSSWYILNTAGNGLPDANLQVLILQITTAGDVSGSINYQVFPLGVGADQAQVQIQFDGVGTFTQADPIEGCTDASACNYDVNANTDDGSCTYIADGECDCDGTLIDDCGVCGGDNSSCTGCSSSIACNYNANATIVDNSLCVYATGCATCAGNASDGTGYVEANDDDGDGICNDTDTCDGVIDECGVCGGTGIPDGDCDCDGNQLDALGVCGGDCMADVDGDGVCDSEILGCTDPTACNYNEFATMDDGSCTNDVDALGVCGGTCLEDANNNGICDTDDIYGCTIELACNFNPDATFEDESCDFVSCLVFGCDDPAACNYDPNADYNDGSCTYPSFPYDCNDECVNDDDGDGICNEFEIPGCTDMDACNFNVDATDDGGNCIYAEEYYDCDGACLNDADGDGFCDELEVPGCQDPTACNYVPLATDEDGSCEYAADYVDCDGNCLNDADGDLVCDELEVAGCDDDMACNYQPEATDNDGSCEYAEDYYDCDGNCLMDTDGDGVCDELEIAGCTDEMACNYSMDATDDDGSCEYAEDYYDCNGDCLNDADGDGVCDELEIAGCTNMEACNYNMDATDDDGSCVLVGDSCDDGDENTINDTIDENCDCVGEEEDGVNEELLSFGLFPNPTTGEVTLSVAGFHSGIQIQVLDGAGRVVWNAENVAIQGNRVMDLSNLSSGTYNVMLSDERGVRVKRLAIQH